MRSRAEPENRYGESCHARDRKVRARSIAYSILNQQTRWLGGKGGANIRMEKE